MIDNILDNDYQSCGCDCAASSGGTPPEFIYMMIPGEWACVYVKLLAAVADFGEQMLKDCQASCKDNSKNIINCWNMFSAAVAAHQLGQDKLADTLIKYIEAQLKVIYRDTRCAEFSTMASLPISADGKIKAFVGCNMHGGSTIIPPSVFADAINRIWNKIEDMTGEAHLGFSMTVTPEYFISDDGCTVHITVDTDDAISAFECVSFYINDSHLVSARNVKHFEYDTEVKDTVTIKCKAKIMGVMYEQSRTITHFNGFWLGAGDAYQDIMDSAHLISVTDEMAGLYNVECSQESNIFIIINDSVKGLFNRATISGSEIPFTESTVSVDGVAYRVFTSVNRYNIGTYNINING